MKLTVKAGIIASALALLPMAFSNAANAGQRYATPPPITLSPDLSSPWTLQIQPKKRRASRSEIRRAQRPKGLKRYKRKAYKQVQPIKRRASISTRRSGIVTASVRRQQRKAVNAGKQIQRDMYPTIVHYNGSAKPGTLIVNTIERRLYLVQPGGKARRYAIGVGKPGFEWAGTHKVSRKAEWPSWRPPAEMIARERKKGIELPKFMPGGIENPLGARALYLGSTIYRIHGTNQAWSIGQAVSSGCIRMRNEDVMDLYERVRVGAKVKVI